MTQTIEEAAKKAIIDNDFFMADPNHPEFVDRGIEQMRACKWVINHIFSLPLASRLTAEEKERVKALHYHLNSVLAYCHPCADKIVEATMHDLESIFGADFFKEEENEQA